MHKRRIIFSALDSRFEVTKCLFNKKQTSCFNHCLLAECCNFLEHSHDAVLQIETPKIYVPCCTKSQTFCFITKSLCNQTSPYLEKHIPLLTQNLLLSVYSVIIQCALLSVHTPRHCFLRNALFFPSINSNSGFQYVQIQAWRPRLCPVSSMATSNLLSEVSHCRNNTGFIKQQVTIYWQASQKEVLDRFKQVELGVLNHKCYIEGHDFLDKYSK